MLTRLAIRNIVLIEALDLAFAGGLGVLTGETGAGKSILLDALGLVLGNRAETALVRAGEDKASVTATFEFSQLPEAVRSALDEAEVEIEPGEPLIIRRSVRGRRRAARPSSTTSRSAWRCCASSPRRWSSCTASTTIAAWSIRAATGRCSTAMPAADVAGVEAAWQGWREAEAALAEARAAIEQAKADQDLLLAHLAELDRDRAAGGRGGSARGGARRHAEGRDGCRAISRNCASCGTVRIPRSPPCAARRGGSTGSLPSMRLLAEALAALDRAVIEAGEAEDKLQAAAEALTHDPAELDRIETRLFELRALARKHRCEVDELPAKMRDMRAALDAIEAGDANIAELEKAERAACEVYRARAEALHAGRVAAALRLDEAVAAELAPLKLDAARFRTAVTELPEERWGPHGMDAVEFLIATNPGADFAPLGKIASGGELSRFILALKVALAEQGGAATVIFDEIDRGVGGAVASAIGERLARLAGGGQLLAVTHSPQVAARGTTHYLIAKSSRGHRHPHLGRTARCRRAAGGDRPDALGRGDHQRGAGAGGSPAGGGVKHALALPVLFAAAACAGVSAPGHTPATISGGPTRTLRRTSPMRCCATARASAPLPSCACPRERGRFRLAVLYHGGLLESGHRDAGLHGAAGDALAAARDCHAQRRLPRGRRRRRLARFVRGLAGFGRS